MSLPVVSYGNYNYGQYANPTPIKYKGGLGEALTGAVVSGIEANKKRKEEYKQALEDSLILSSQFNNQLNKLFGKASAYNKQFLQNLKIDYGNNVKDYKLGKISFEDFQTNQDYFDGILNEATLLSQIMQPIVEDENDIKFSQARGDADNQASVLTRWGIKNGKYLLDRDENGLKVVVAHGTPGNFSPKGITAAELINNPKYVIPELKYDNAKNPLYNQAVAALKSNLLLKPDLITATNYEKTSQTLFNIDPTKQDQIMNEIANQDGIKEILSSELQKRTYYEDIMTDKNGNPNGVGTYVGDSDQIAAIEKALATDLYNTLAKNPIGSKPYKKPSDDLTSAQKIALGKQKDLENDIDQAIKNLNKFVEPDLNSTPEELTNQYIGLEYSSGTGIKTIKRIDRIVRNTNNDLVVDLVLGAGTTGATSVLKNVNLRDPNVIARILPGAAKRDYPDISKDIITKYNLSSSSDYKGIKI